MGLRPISDELRYVKDIEWDPPQFLKVFEMFDEADRKAALVASCKAEISTLKARTTAIEEIVAICEKANFGK